MLVQLRDHDLLDAGFDDFDGLSRPMTDDSDEADLRYVERILETDFGLDFRTTAAKRRRATRIPEYCPLEHLAAMEDAINDGTVH